jgi:hypothetical protein
MNQPGVQAQFRQQVNQARLSLARPHGGPLL